MHYKVGNLRRKYRAWPFVVSCAFLVVAGVAFNFFPPTAFAASCSQTITSYASIPVAQNVTVNYSMYGGGGGGGPLIPGNAGSYTSGSTKLSSGQILQVYAGGGGGGGGEDEESDIYSAGGGGAGWYGGCGGSIGVYIADLGGGGGGSSAIVMNGSVIAYANGGMGGGGNSGRYGGCGGSISSGGGKGWGTQGQSAYASPGSFGGSGSNGGSYSGTILASGWGVFGGGGGGYGSGGGGACLRGGGNGGSNGGLGSSDGTMSFGGGASYYYDYGGGYGYGGSGWGAGGGGGTAEVYPNADPFSGGFCANGGNGGSVTLTFTSPQCDLTQTAYTNPPVPTLTGSSSGYTGVAYTYTLTGTDPNSATIRYGVSWNNNGNIDEYDPVTGYVNSGTQQSTTHTWNTPGTYTIAALTNDSLGYSSAWATKTITVAQAATAVLAASSTSFRQGDAADTLTWASAGATSCAGTNFSTGGATGGSINVTPTATTTYTVACIGGSGTATSTVTINYRPDQPPTIPAISGQNNITQGQSNTYTFTATDPEGDTLHYGVDWTGSGSVMQWLPATSSYVLSGIAATSSYAQSATGTITLKALAQDARGQSSGWGTLTLSVAPACTPSAICSGGNVVNSCGGALMQSCSYGCNNGACFVPSPSFATSTYNGMALSGHLQLRPSLIRKNESAHVFWNVSNASSCQVTSSANVADAWSSVSAPAGGATTSPILGQTTFTLSCSALPGATSTGVYEQQMVNVAPVFREQ